jgi:hypothetical protein
VTLRISRAIPGLGAHPLGDDVTARTPSGFDGNKNRETIRVLQLQLLSRKGTLR